MTHIEFHKQQVEKMKNVESDRPKLGDKSVNVPHSLGLSSHGRGPKQSSPEMKTLPYLLPSVVWRRVFFILENPEISAGLGSQEPGNPE